MEVLDYAGGRLAEDEVNFFRAFGYLIFRGLIGQDELDAISSEVADATTVRRADETFDPAAAVETDRRQWAIMMGSSTPTHAGLLEDDRFLSLAWQLYGPDVLGIKVQANRLGGSTPWHRDTYTSLRGGIKFIFYHQAVTGRTGALRVVPASHLLGDNYLFAEKLRRLPPEQVPSTALETNPGDVIAFDMRAWHGSFGGTERIASDLSYYNNPRTAEEEEALRLRASTNVQILMQKFGGGQSYFYPREWTDNSGGSPIRAKWLERLREVGYFDAPGMVEGDLDRPRPVPVAQSPRS